MSDERKIQEVLARYVRATDQHDGKAQGALFTDDAVVHCFSRTGPGSSEPVAPPMIGGAAVEYAVDHYMAPHPVGGSSHHVTADHIIEVDGDRARMNAQFIVFRIQAAAGPEGGWAEGTFGSQGRVAHRVRVLRHRPAPDRRRVEDRGAPDPAGHAVCHS